jgi:pimeloyl-ACP methyl ester carboxylesterase
MTALIALGFHVVGYDTREHGESDWAVDGDYSFDAMRDDLLAVIGTTPGRPVLIGASMGGSTALIAIGESDATICTGAVTSATPCLVRLGCDHRRRIAAGPARSRLRLLIPRVFVTGVLQMRFHDLVKLPNVAFDRT